MDNHIPQTNSTGVITDGPSTEIERQMVDIWREVLQRESVGIHDDFLDLGGHSMAAMVCINRLTELYGVELPLDLFFMESACIAQLAAELERMRGN